MINPAGFSFRSIPVPDALRMLDAAIVEIHITNIHALTLPIRTLSSRQSRAL